MNFILGTIYGYSWEEIEPFFESYRQAGYKNTKCIMFVKNLTKRTKRKLISYDVEIIEDVGNSTTKWITEYRWEVYKRYLDENKSDGEILLTDVRDTIFQQDIFKKENRDIVIGIEADTIGNEDCNATWVRRRFGIEIFNILKDKPIICAGTVLGRFEDIYKLICLMVDTMNSGEYNFFKNCDQANLNWLFYSGAMGENVSYSSNQSGKIMTLRIENHADVIDGYIVNGDKDIAAVVHQYDRMPKLIDLVEERYTSSGKLFNRLLKHRHFRGVWRKI